MRIKFKKSGVVSYIHEVKANKIKKFIVSKNQDKIMEEFHIRLNMELNELLERKIKLHEFVISKKFKSLKHIQQSLMWVQLMAMDTYATCLQERINDLERERINDN